MPKKGRVGILGIRTKSNPILLFAKDELWESDDSEDSDYDGGDKSKSVNDGRREKLAMQDAKVHFPNPPKKRLKESDEISNADGRWGTLIPPELLVHIFHYVAHADGAVPFLVRASKVCRLWSRVSSDDSLWQKVDLSSECVMKKAAVLTWLCEHRLGKLRELNLSGWKSELSESCFKTLVHNHCEQLERLNLSMCKVSSPVLHSIADRCPKLCDLNISSIESDSKFTAEFKYLMALRGSKFTHIYLDTCPVNLTPIVGSIADHCPKLLVLDISNPRPIAGWTNMDIEKFQEKCPKLRVFRAANSTIMMCGRQVETDWDGFRYLEELSIPRYQLKGGHFLFRVARGSSDLKLLDIRECGFSMDCLLFLPCSDIEHLYLSRCKIHAPTLEELFDKWSHSLVTLDISWCDFSEETMARALSILASKAKRLRHLDITGTATKLESVRVLLHGCKTLQSLNLTSCRWLPRGLKRCYSNAEDFSVLKEAANQCNSQLPQMNECLPSSHTNLLAFI